MNKTWTCVLFVGTATAVLLTAAIVRDGAAQSSDARAGKRLFHEADWTATRITCIHCHADFNEKKTPDGYVRAGHPLYNAGFRSEYHAWDGSPVATLGEAIAICMKRWMTERVEGGGEEPAQHEVRQLIAYLQSDELTVERKSKAIELMWSDKLPGDRLLELGDPGLGGAAFKRSCSMCHLPDGSGAGPSLTRNGYSRYQIAKKIRGIDNEGLNGLIMPRFPKDRLSDRELINVVAFVYQM
jgi:mono/diheme cytochrome c family protein